MADNFQDMYEELISNLYSQSVNKDLGPYSQYKNYLVSPDGTFLGKLTRNKYDSLGIFNPYGTHGSRYSSHSITNPYSNYGSKYSTYSPYNPYAQNPPEIYLNNKLSGRLTVNKYLNNATSPEALFKRILTESQFAY